MMHRSAWCSLVASLSLLSLLCCASPLRAQTDIGITVAVSVNPTDGSCWVLTHDRVAHLAEDGTILSESFEVAIGDDDIHNLYQEDMVCVDPVRGSCWVADPVRGEVVLLASDGTVADRFAGFDEPWSVSVNPVDGSCWIVDWGSRDVVRLSKEGYEELRWSEFALSPWSVAVYPGDGSCWIATTQELIHLSADGQVMWRSDEYSPHAVAVNHRDGSCWVVSRHQNFAAHIAEDGTELWRSTDDDRSSRRLWGPVSISVNATDGSCWIAQYHSNEVIHLAEDGTWLWQGTDFEGPASVSVNPTDSSCWVADRNNHSMHGYMPSQVLHLFEDGSRLYPEPLETNVVAWRSSFGVPRHVAVNPADGSCWAQTGSSVMHISRDGEVLGQKNGFWAAMSLAVNSTDGSCWVADTLNNRIVHLAADMTELSRTYGFDEPISVSVDPVDMSCWVADYGNGEVVLLAEDGTELWRKATCSGSPFELQPWSVCVNPTDGSCWIGQVTLTGPSVLHLDRDGEEIWSGYDNYYIRSVSVNPVDGSCWAAVYPRGLVIHIDANGKEKWRSKDWPDDEYQQFVQPHSVSVDPNDGSCWVADYAYDVVVRIGADYDEMLRLSGFVKPDSVAVNVDPDDRTCWVGDLGNAALVHLSPEGSELWRDRGDLKDPSNVCVDPGTDICWVSDKGNDQVVQLNPDGSEVRRIGGPGDFNAPGDLSVNPLDHSCWVTDNANYQIVHLSAEGDELMREEYKVILDGFLTRLTPYRISANPGDNSCRALAGTGLLEMCALLSISEEGILDWYRTEFTAVQDVAVNPIDGSCWVTDHLGHHVYYIDAEGEDVIDPISLPYALAVDVSAADGSCWVSHGYPDSDLVRFRDDGSELTRSPAPEDCPYVSVDPRDGSVWAVSDSHWGPDDFVQHISADGTLLWEGGSSVGPYCVSFNPHDGSCWVTERAQNQVLRIVRGHRVLLRGPGGTTRVNGDIRRTPWSDGFPADETVVLEAIPDPWYNFVGWSGDVSGTENPIEFVLDGDKVITANFEIVQHSLSMTADGNGQVAVDGEVPALPWSRLFDHGTEVTLEAVAETGWVFLGWTGDVVSQENPIDVSVDGDMSVEAVFAVHTFAVSAATPDPQVVGSGGSTQLGASYTDSGEHGILWWQWDDGGAGGAFVPASANVGDPLYIAPMNTSDTPVAVTLTVSAGCDGWEGLSDSDATTLEVAPVPHTLSVEAECTPIAPISEGLVACTATYSDSRGHVVATWEWSDGGAGGGFTPSAGVQNPTYRTPVNEGDEDVAIELVVTAICAGPEPATATDTIELRVRPGVEFGDVDSEHWASAEIMACVNAGIVVGYDDDLYHPELPVDRAQMAVYIARAEGWVELGDDMSTAPELFTDVPAGHWAGTAIEACVTTNVVHGYPDGSYQPEVIVTRELMAVYIARALVAPAGDEGVPEGPSETTFPDVPVDHWAYDHVECCVEEGVVEGYDDGLYRPVEDVTRDQMAVYICRAYELPH